MKKSLVLYAMVVLLSTAAGHASAADILNKQKEATENGPASSVLETDPRLSRKITYFSKAKPLRTILDEVSQASGVTLKTGYNNLDWQVRDRRMNIFVKDMCLWDIMSSIARVMNFKWIKSESGEQPTYRLIMDRKQILEVERFRAEALQRFHQEVRTRRESALEEMDRIANLPPDELEKLREEKPALYLYATTGEAGFLAALAKENPAARNAIMSGTGCVVRASDLSDSGRAALLEGVRGMWFLMTTGSPRHWEPMPERAVNEVPNAVIRIIDQGPPSPSSLSFLAKLEIRFGPDRLVTYLPNGADPVQNAYAVGTLRCREENVAGKDMWPRLEYKKMFEEAYAGLAADIDEYYPGEPKLEHADEPWMHDKLKAKAEGRLSSILEALAESSEFSVISDSFGGSDTTMGSFDEGAEFKSLLNALEARYYNWEKTGSVLEFRDRNWFKRRAAQIPDEWLDGWSNRLKQAGFLDISDLAQIARLDNEQVWENIRCERKPLGDDSFLSALDNVLWNCRDVLRLYATLTANQRRIAFGQGLSLDSLSPEQWDLGLFALTKNSKLLEDVEAGLVLTCKRNISDSGLPDYDLTVIGLGPGNPKAQWKFTAPQYTPPQR